MVLLDVFFFFLGNIVVEVKIETFIKVLMFMQIEHAAF